MLNFISSLKQELSEAEGMLKVIQAELRSAPDGRLVLKRVNGKVYYYYRAANSNRDIYIGISETKFIRNLAQKAYNQKVLRCMKKRIARLRHCLITYNKTDLDELYRRQKDERKNLVRPIRQTWEQIVEEWTQRPYLPLPAPDKEPLLLTEKGEAVRSKSEKIIADYLSRQGVPYKYECPVMLNGWGDVYPDFTLPAYPGGEDVYWEHLGRMDDPSYAEKAVRKINAYVENGYIPGDRLILTFETSQTVINTKALDTLVHKYKKN